MLYKISHDLVVSLLGAVPQIFDRVKSVALWSAKKKIKIKRPFMI
jgi:hypothetical protein